jgi:two-component system torCAD operon response regulator TorR
MRQEQHSPIKVLIFEGEDSARNLVTNFLTHSGMMAKDAKSAHEFEELRKQQHPDVIALGLNAPTVYELSLVEQVRKEGNCGIIILSSNCENSIRMLTLSLGADNYFEKPINLKELEFSIRNLYERIRKPEEEKKEGQWLFDADNWLLTAPNGDNQRLSEAEYMVISRLSDMPGHPVSREHLLEELNTREKNNIGNDRSLDVLISRLRRKFSYTRQMLPVQSARGYGYVFPGVTVVGEVKRRSQVTLHK